MHSEGANTMQNEERIGGLETQVRTLKRIVYGFGCLLVAGVVVGAQTPNKTTDEEKIIKVQLVGPIKIDECVYVRSGTNRNNLRPFQIQSK